MKRPHVPSSGYSPKANRTLRVEASSFEKRVSGDTRFCRFAQCAGLYGARQLILIFVASRQKHATREIELTPEA